MLDEGLEESRAPALDKRPVFHSFIHRKYFLIQFGEGGPVPARSLLFTASYFIATATNLLLPQPTGNVLVAKFSRLNRRFLALKSQSLSGSLTDDVILNVLGFFFPFPLSQTNSFLACLTLTPILHEPYLSMLQHFPWLPRITKSWAVAAR